MKILVLNCGSSTLKFQLLGVEGLNTTDSFERLARGTVDGVGGPGTLEFTARNGETHHQDVTFADHGQATQEVFDWLESSKFLQPDGLGAIGHRVVHGAHRFTEPTLIDDGVIEALEVLRELAPLHNEPALQAIRAARSAFAAIPMVAVFDTAFHRTLPAKASHYAIPQELAEKHHVRRYGFHGLAHRSMAERYASIARQSLRLITMQLGNGCSMAAVEGGQSVDTSMGFTPLEGLVMGTRSGDVDPSLAGFLARREGVPVEAVESWLNTRSGLLGVSDRSRDMRELLEASRQGDASAELAVDIFCYRARKYLGAYLAVLGGADAVIFGGGIGENAPAVRTRICAGMEWCGLSVDPARNDVLIGEEGRIASDSSIINAYVIPVDEEAIIARDTLHCLREQGK